MKKNYNGKSKTELIKIIYKKDSRIKKLEAKKCKLEKRLLAYENAHTPSSKQRFNKKEVNKEKSGKLGAPKGHPKYTRKEPTPDKTIVYDEVDEIYQNKELAFLGERVIYEEEIPEPQPVFVTKHVIYFYLDLESHKIVFAKNNAPKGAFGKNAETHIALLKFVDRLPLRKVEESLQRQHNLRITNVGIYNVAKRVSRKLNIPYYEIIKAIRSSDVLYIDETQYKLNGKTWWLWVFVSKETVLFVIRNSRGKEVIEEILGKTFNGKISADGWKVYKNFAKILQRCWAHLLRECDELENEYKSFSFKNKQIHDLFIEIYKIREDPPPEDKRKILQQEMKERLEFIARNMLVDKGFKKLGTKILNGLENWFTCVEHLDIEPTNNFAEQALREPIVQRKIMGGLRSKDGAFVLERIITCLASWKKQGKPLFETLRSYL